MKKILILFLMSFFTVPVLAADFDEQRFLRNYAQILVVGRGFLFNENDIDYIDNKIWKIDGHTVHYNNDKIERIGSESVYYFPNGVIHEVGDKSIRYDEEGRIDWLGNKTIDYSWGDHVFTVEER